MGSASAEKWAGSATQWYANATTRRTSSNNENVCYFVGHRTDCASVEQREVAARPKSKQTRLIRPDGKHFCQNSDIQRGISAVGDNFKVTSALLTNI
jgi:hypothetical protein